MIEAPIMCHVVLDLSFFWARHFLLQCNVCVSLHVAAKAKESGVNEGEEKKQHMNVPAS